MADHPPIKTLGTVTFGPCGQDNHELFRVNPDIPLRQALEQVSALLYCAKKLALDAALDRLAELDPARAQLVELRYFGGLTIEETAEALGVSPATAKRHWQAARAWLFEALAEPG